MKEIISDLLCDVEDPRSRRNQKHGMVTLIGTTFLAALAGQDSFSGIADFVESHVEFLKDYFDFPHGPASHDTYQRFWEAINPQFIERYVFDFTRLLMRVAQDIICIDGKTIRNSKANAEDKDLHIVSAWCDANEMVFAQEKVDGKSNEITAIPKLLSMLDLQGHIVTADAMAAQHAICAQIIEQGGDYVISLKGNQGTLRKDIQLFFENIPEGYVIEEARDYDKGHGRIEERVSRVCHDVAWLQDHGWEGLASIGRVDTRIEKKGKVSEETRYYITSIGAVSARRLNSVVRSHWGIENKLHWRLDVVFNEDKGCIRNDNAAENMNLIRKWALNVLHKAKTKPDQSLKSLMRKNAMSSKHIKNTVKSIFHA